MGLAQMGAGPGLTQGIARAHAAQKRDQEAALLSAAFRLTSLGALLGGGAVVLVIHLIPPGRLFGVLFAADRPEIIASADICVLVMMAQMIAGVVDSALAGYQEQVLSSLAAMIGNFVSIGLLIVVCRGAVSINGVVLVLYGVPMLSRVGNLVVLYLRRPYLLHGVLYSARGFYSALLNVGLAFWGFQLCGLLSQNGGTFVLARLSSTHDTDLFAIVYKYLALASMAVNVITQPLWPAITDAVAHRDIDWIRRSYARILRLLSLFSCTLAVISMTAGPWIFQHILHVDTSGQYPLFVILGIYFVANIWTHLLYIIMMGMPGIWRATSVLLAENLLMLLFAVLLVPHFGAAGMALAYLLASVILPTWLLPRLMRQELERATAAPWAV